MKGPRLVIIDASVGARFKMDVHPFLRVFLEVCRQHSLSGKPASLFQKCLPIIHNSIAVGIDEPAAEAIVLIRPGSRHQALLRHRSQGISELSPLFTVIIDQDTGAVAAVPAGLYIRRKPLRRQASMGSRPVGDIRP